MKCTERAVGRRGQWVGEDKAKAAIVLREGAV